MPDEPTLALWVEDELDGPTAATVDAWAADQPEWLDRRAQARRLKPLLRTVFPATEEPPYAEFFNARIGREIGREAAAAEPLAPAVAASSGIWRWFVPVTAVAGVVLGFWAGTRVAPAPAASAAAPVPAAVMPVVYTPERGVNAEYFSSASADATVIVLDGVAAIPDSFEIPETAATAGPDVSTAGFFLPAP